MLSEKEKEYINSQRLARISTVAPDDLQPDAVPVGFDFDGEYFYVGGMNLLRSTKYKNIQKNSKVAIVIDDLKSVNPWEPRGVRIYGIALKMAVDTWHSAPAGSEERAMYFRVAEGIRWTEDGVQSNYRILQGAVAVIYGIAIVKSALFSRWIGALGIFAGAAVIIAGVVIGYLMFSSDRDVMVNISTVGMFVWLGLGYFHVEKITGKESSSITKMSAG